MPEEKTYAVPALEKGMKILEDLAASSEPLSIVDLARIQGKGRNEIYRMLCSLESLGYITREASTKRYSLSLKLFQMANRYPPLERLRLVARQPLLDLADRIQESCHLCVMDGPYLSVVAQASGNERIRISFRLGARFDPLETCSGKLLLCELDESSRSSCLEHSGLWLEAKQPTRKSILAALSRRPKQRVWVEDSLLRPGVRDIAVALGTPDSIHATLAVAHLTHRQNALSEADIRRHLIACAREIETRLGITPGD
jgi:DNA-binding IclR family transcriptional regulator